MKVTLGFLKPDWQGLHGLGWQGGHSDVVLQSDLQSLEGRANLLVHHGELDELDMLIYYD